VGASNDLADGRPPVQFLFQARNTPKFFQRSAVIGLEHFFLLDRGHVLDRDFHAVDCA
jgi:hypothetical protein